MTTLTPLTAYTGDVPVKAEQTPETFATNVGLYLDYFNATFTPQTNGWVTQVNALSAEYEAVNAMSADEINVFTVAQRGEIEVLTYGATVDIDMDLANRYKFTQTGNVTVTASNVTEGQGGVLYITQDSGGSNTVSFNSIFKFMDATYTLDSVGNKTNAFGYEVFSSSAIVITYLGSF